MILRGIDLSASSTPTTSDQWVIKRIRVADLRASTDFPSFCKMLGITFDKGAVENCLFSNLILSLCFLVMLIETDNTPSAIRDAMLDWYDAHRRDLPWRSNPCDTPNPYHVWMSEIMLQQTTVQAVKPYFKKFIKLWPTIQDLAKASQDEVLKQWAGLGYYSRARNLHKCANMLVNEFNGVFPQDVTSLKTLIGVGDYTAAAIRSIAFNKSATVIDGNVDRVISRIYRIDTPLPQSKPLIKKYAESLFEGKNTKRPSCFAQSLMDLGAGICTPKAVRCELCPITDYCEGHKHEDGALYPKRLKKKPLPQKHAYVFLNVTSGMIEVEKRAEKGMLGGMQGFPTSEWIDIKEDLPKTHGQVFETSVKHVFTHFALTLHPVIKLTNSLNMIEFEKVNDIGLPTLFKKVWKIMKDELDVIE